MKGIYKMITLSKDGIFYENKFEDGKKKKVKSLIPYLNKVIQLEEDFTLIDFFNILENDKELINIIFSSQLGHYPLQLYINDIKKEIVKGEEQLDFLKVHWSCGFEQGECSEFEPENEISIFASFGGWGVWEDNPWTNYEVDEDGKIRGGFAIEFTPLSELKDLPLKLELDMEFKDENQFIKEENNYKTILKGKRPFTVYEVIGAILYEISFVGDPEKRDDAWKEQLETVEDIKNSKEGKFVSIDDLMKDLNSD
jgi:hypothetical protein